MLKLPRVAYDLVKWYGRGPWENYPDRKQSCPIGWYECSVENQFTHYPRPQDNGNHEDCSYIELTNKNGKNALQVIAAGDTPLSFSALPYSVADLYAARHDFELKQSGNPNLRYTYLAQLDFDESVSRRSRLVFSAGTSIFSSAETGMESPHSKKK